LRAGAQFARFTGTNLQLAFASFTGTKVQVLTQLGVPDDELESLRVDAQSEACCNSEVHCNSALHDGRNGVAKAARGRESAAREGDMRPAEHECESDISDLAAVAAGGPPDLAAVAAGGRDSQMSKQVRDF